MSEHTITVSWAGVVGSGNRWHAVLKVKRGWWVTDTVGGPIFECDDSDKVWRFERALQLAKAEPVSRHDRAHLGRTQPTAYRALAWLREEARKTGREL